MKKLMIPALAIVALSGCQTTSVSEMMANPKSIDKPFSCELDNHANLIIQKDGQGVYLWSDSNTPNENVTVTNHAIRKMKNGSQSHKFSIMQRENISGDVYGGIEADLTFIDDGESTMRGDWEFKYILVSTDHGTKESKPNERIIKKAVCRWDTEASIDW
ncbi:hypothetical protein J4N45_24165 [Vibrio sp. SCSIO 43140]|uniref:hypothetical protein n=1 Tax=Vibrio sp. SCSIO 43140 TaxID=2819100 RepID=UPI002074E181|nr:hypothetical protein [Vibrio sp. SCSIO 43140]USD62462.1 hypothetical protein J4N45_24165 [Vibrio sp. SCSIO 43140]